MQWFGARKRPKATERHSLLEVGGLTVHVTRKAMKTLRLRVVPPDGEVRLSAPLRVTDAELCGFVTSRLEWIARHQQRIAQTPSVRPLEMLDGENHYALGTACRLTLIPHAGRPYVLLEDGRLELHLPGDSDAESRRALLERWYRSELLRLVPPLMTQWEERLNVRAASWHVRRMKSRWGSCNVRARRVWLSLELAKYPLPCLEYVIVHELAHLHERGHGPRFKALLDAHLPDWELRKKMLTTLGRNSAFGVPPQTPPGE